LGAFNHGGCVTPHGNLAKVAQPEGLIAIDRGQSHVSKANLFAPDGT
jgi:hypothetical protein